ALAPAPAFVRMRMTLSTSAAQATVYPASGTRIVNAAVVSSVGKLYWDTSAVQVTRASGATSASATLDILVQGLPTGWSTWTRTLPAGGTAATTLTNINDRARPVGVLTVAASSPATT